MNYKVTIDKFEGPLDLLLHLIKESDIDIFDIKISEITNQYLIYISQMKELNLNIDSEYLIMAANLIEIKSRELLPHDEESDDLEEDPKEILINRLVEYQKYKELSKSFEALEKERHELFTKEPSLLSEFKDDKLKIDDNLSLDDLIKAFAKLNERKQFEKPLNTVVTKKEYSIHTRNREIMDILTKNKQVYFEELFENYTKDYIVVTFLSILDLAKKGNIKIKQSHYLDRIILLNKGV